MDELTQLRQKVDKLDHELLEIMAARMRIVEEIKRYKANHHLTAYDPQRFQEIMSDRRDFATDLKLDPLLAEKLFTLIHDHSLKLQTDLVTK